MKKIKQSWYKYLETGSRSNQKLKILHGWLAEMILNKINELKKDNSTWTVSSLNENGGKEEKVIGKYMDKAVDIVIKKNGKQIMGITVKFVMSNYSQNANNYFENLLGETSNIRSNGIHYCSALFLFEEIPYYDDKQNIKSWQNIKKHIHKYKKMSQDDKSTNYQSPNKNLICIIKNPEINKERIINKKEFKELFLTINNEWNPEFTNERYSEDDLFINEIDSYVKSVAQLCLES